MTVEQRALASILDVVEEIAGKVGEPEWAACVAECFNSHRRELRTGVIEHDEPENDRPALTLVASRPGPGPGQRRIGGKWFYSARWL
jgi:hypothetical protein